MKGGLSLYALMLIIFVVFFCLYGVSIPYGYLLLPRRVPRSSWLCAPWVGWGL